MSDKVKISGGCLCGAVRCEVTQSPDDDTYYCHCRKCQKALGGLFGCFVIFTGPNIWDTFTFIRGEPKFYRSSKWAERGFCRTCGTPLEMRDSEGFAVMIGSLDHPEDFPPTVHAGVESQVPWLILMTVYPVREQRTLRIILP
ncbi:MAG: GFA family protein [Proteobacteria bacterium]|nr:GFA family protein [Pseudomonadota bacterium]